MIIEDFCVNLKIKEVKGNDTFYKTNDDYK